MIARKRYSGCLTTHGLVMLGLYFLTNLTATGAPISVGDVPVTETFDSASVTSTPVDLLSPWRWSGQSGARAMGAYSSGELAVPWSGGGSSTFSSGGAYSFWSGTGSSGSERAFGFLGTSTSLKSYTLFSQFQAGKKLDALNISYDIEKYKAGTNPDLQFQLYFNLSSSNNAWVSAGDVFTTTFQSEANGFFSNTPGSSQRVSGTYTLPSSIAKDNTFCLALTYTVSIGSSLTNAPALAIDNFTISSAPEPASIIWSAGTAFVAFARRRRL